MSGTNQQTALSDSERREAAALIMRPASALFMAIGGAAVAGGGILYYLGVRSAAGGRYWLVKMSSAFGRFLKS